MNLKNIETDKSSYSDNLFWKELQYWNEEQDLNWDYSYDTGRENLLKYFSTSYKPTKDIISENQSFFKTLSNIEQVFVLGHSLSVIDKPYFEEIIKSIKVNSKWTVSYYYRYEMESHKKALEEMGINDSNIKLIELSLLQLRNKQLNLELE